MNPLCYLCGEEIIGRPSYDHIPPQQLYSPTIRREHNLDGLKTRPTHSACNHAYGRDEEYVISALVAVSLGAPTANALVAHHAAQFRSGRRQGLVRRILSSMTDRPSGLHLPNGGGLMRLDGARVKRVMWKIVRGLYFIEHQAILPASTPYYVESKEPGNSSTGEFDDIWELVKSQPQKGDYPGVFAYKHLFAEEDSARLHAWGMLWWDSQMWFVAHHASTVGDAAG